MIDEIIELDREKTREKYPKHLRRVAVYNEEHGLTIELLTNNMSLAASTIADLYKSRWQIEMFFRNLKQLFHIKSFVGTTRNAVEIQLWTALTTILILADLRAIAKYPWHPPTSYTPSGSTPSRKSICKGGSTTLSRRQKMTKALSILYSVVDNPFPIK